MHIRKLKISIAYMHRILKNTHTNCMNVNYLMKVKVSFKKKKITIYSIKIFSI